MNLGKKFVSIVLLITIGDIIGAFALIFSNFLLFLIAIVPLIVARSIWFSYENEKGNKLLWTIVTIQIVVVVIISIVVRAS